MRQGLGWLLVAVTGNLQGTVRRAPVHQKDPAWARQTLAPALLVKEVGELVGGAPLCSAHCGD